jgi:hypothetical protein
MTETVDPAVTLEQKLTAFAETLTDDERTVLHDVMHLAREGSEVEGFALPKSGLTGDPCEGGEVTFPGVFTLIGNLHGSLHRTDPSAPRPVPMPYPNQG